MPEPLPEAEQERLRAISGDISEAFMKLALSILAWSAGERTDLPVRATLGELKSQIKRLEKELAR